MKPEHNKLSVSMAATTAKVFFKEMAQDKEEYQPRLLTSNTILHYALTRDNSLVCCLVGYINEMRTYLHFHRSNITYGNQ